MKIRFGLVLALALGLGSTGCASGGGGGGGGGSAPTAAAGSERPRETDNTRTAEQHLEAADAAGDQGEAHYRQALTAAEAAVAEDPRNPLAHRLVALASVGLRDFEAAGEHFDTAAELYPLYEFEDTGIRENLWIELYNEGSEQVGAGDYEAAAAAFEGSNAIYPNRPEAFMILGQLYVELEQYDRALENMDRAVEVIAEAEAGGQMDSTLVAGWREQTTTYPMQRAQILSAAGRFEDAVQALRGLVAADPRNIDLKRNLAVTLLQMGNQAEAFQVYEEILAQPGLRGSDYYQVGLGFYEGEEYGRAAQAFSQAVGASRNDRDGLEMWARSLQLDSAYAEIEPVGERWIALDPYNQNAYLITAQAVNQLGQGARAGELVQQIDGLEVKVNDLFMRRTAAGVQVSGSVANAKLQPGTSVTFRFTFYAPSGATLTTIPHQVSVGGEGMSVPFEVQFETEQDVGGYGYAVTIG